MLLSWNVWENWRCDKSLAWNDETHKMLTEWNTILMIGLLSQSWQEPKVWLQAWQIVCNLTQEVGNQSHFRGGGSPQKEVSHAARSVSLSRQCEKLEKCDTWITQMQVSILTQLVVRWMRLDKFQDSISNGNFNKGWGGDYSRQIPSVLLLCWYFWQP